MKKLDKRLSEKNQDSRAIYDAKKRLLEFEGKIYWAVSRQSVPLIKKYIKKRIIEEGDIEKKFSEWEVV